MAEDDKTHIDKLIYLLIGAGLGATLALLFAPKSGRELREDIADYTRKGIDAANEGARRAGARAGELYDTGRERVADAYGIAREKVAESISDAAARQRDHLEAAIEAGKQAYRDEGREAALGGVRSPGEGPDEP